MRFRLRTLLILLAIMPPLIWFGWMRYEAWRAEQERQLWLGKILNGVHTGALAGGKELIEILRRDAMKPPDDDE